MAKPKQKKQKNKPPVIERVDWSQVARWTFAMAILLALGGGGAWGVLKLQQPDVLPLKVVRIDGELKNLNRTELEHVVGGVMQGNFFMVNLATIRRAAEDLAWVDQVTIKRVWPDKLQIWVREQVPLARWGKKRLVSRAGIVFKPKPEEIPRGLPYLSGPDARALDVVKQYRRISQKVAGVALVVDKLRMDARYAWSVGFRGGIELKLGKEEIVQRLARFLRLYPELKRQSDKTAKRIDLRYTNGVAVLWGEAS